MRGSGDAGESTRSEVPRSRVPALDGLRGVAVTAVVVNHFRPSALPGGWLGVDLFFVLSGYLITSLLLAEHAASRRIDLRHFYSRRARRLLPALFLLLVVLALVARVDPAAVGFQDLRGEGLAALGYIANWHFAFTHVSYFGSFAPSPLRHLWSLSVEEQFYLVWPVIVVVVLRRFNTLAVGAVALGLAVGSATAMALAYGDGANVSRAYFGTDTHAHGVLLGCVLAVVGPARVRWPFRRIAALLATVGLASAFALLDGTSVLAYRGGIAVTGVLAAVVIAGLVAPGDRGPVGWIAERRPLRALGRISYGIYLWHWPVLVFMNAARVGMSGWPLLTFQLALTLALAVTSFWLLEQPVLNGWPSPRWSRVGAPAFVAAVAVVAAVVPTAPAPFAAAQQQAAERSADDAPPPARPAGAPPAAGPRRVVVVGDSVAYTLFPGLRANERRSGMYFLTAARTGCPLDIAATAYRLPDMPQTSLDLPDYCDWPRTWPPMIDRRKPDLVVALWGLWDLYDHEVDGTWLSVGSPGWNAHMEQTFDRALELVVARGARMIAITTPYLYGFPNTRIDAFNGLLRAAEARHRDRLTVVDIQPAMDFLRPQRWDDVHFTAQGAEHLGRFIVPAIARAIAERPGSVQAVHRARSASGISTPRARPRR